LQNLLQDVGFGAMPPALASSRVARTRARNKLRVKEREEQRLKQQMEEWFGTPLRTAIRNQSQSLEDLNGWFVRKEGELTREVQRVSEKMFNFENRLSQMVREQVDSAMESSRQAQEQRHHAEELKMREMSEDVRRLSEQLLHAYTGLKNDFTKHSTQVNTRLAELGNMETDYHQTKIKLDNLQTELTDYVSKQTERDAVTLHLEAVVKDMADRLWPWRTNMDRSQSPPREAFNPQSQEWLPWPKSGAVRPSGYSSIPALLGPMPQAQQTPQTPHTPQAPQPAYVRRNPPAPSPPRSRPASRPNSARFRGRETTPVKKVRPSSASSLGR